MFIENVALVLKLTIDNKITEILGANIKSWDLDLKSWGFTGRLTFWVDGAGSQQSGNNITVSPTSTVSSLGSYNSLLPQPGRTFQVLLSKTID